MLIPIYKLNECRRYEPLALTSLYGKNSAYGRTDCQNKKNTLDVLKKVTLIIWLFMQHCSEEAEDSMLLQ
jgi:hypothetical protein